MSKELKAFNGICCNTNQSYPDFQKQRMIVETALKNEYEEKFDLIKQVRELKDENASLKSFNSKLWVERQDNEKKLKALEIIKEKRVDVCYFMNCRTLEEYNDDVLGSYAYEKDDAEQRMLTQEEYDLLKEVLL